MALEYTSSETKELSQDLTGLNILVETSQDLIGPGSVVQATQDYVQSYQEALNGYRRRFVVLERYSALLNR